MIRHSWRVAAILAVVLGAIRVTRQTPASLRDQIHTGDTIAPATWKAIQEGSPGIPEAGATLVVFYSLSCGYCRKFDSVLKQLDSSFSGRLRIIRRYVVTRSVWPPYRLAAGSICAARQGRGGAFDSVARGLGAFRGSTADLAQLGVTAEIPDLSEYQRCVDDGATFRRLDDDSKWVERLGIGTTPTTIVNGVVVEGYAPYNLLAPLIGRAVKIQSSGSRR